VWLEPLVQLDRPGMQARRELLDKWDRSERLVLLVVPVTQELLDSPGSRDSKVRSVSQVSKVILDRLEIQEHRVY
jgi:hypothetical protein